MPIPMQDIADHGQHASDGEKCAERRAAQEVVARGLGYMPTNPESLSSHDKRRLYLDCLEQYVDHLHIYMVAIGVQPVPIERVSFGRGLTSRSIRTLIIHLQRQASTLSTQSQELQLQLTNMRAFVDHASGGSDPEYTPTFDCNAPSLALKTSQTLTSITSSVTVGPYAKSSECYEETPSENDLYHNSASCRNFPISPLTSSVPDGENPSYIVPAQTHATSALVATTAMMAPMSTLTPAPSSVQFSGPVPPSLGSALSSSDPVQHVRRRFSIETIPPPYETCDAPFQQQHYQHLSIPQAHCANENSTYRGVEQRHSVGMASMHDTQRVQQQQGIPSSIYSPLTSAVVPSSALPAHHTTPPNVVPCNVSPVCHSTPSVVPSNVALVTSYHTILPRR